MAIYRVCGSSYSTIHALSLSASDIFSKLQNILTLYELSFTYYQFEICRACMPHGDSYGFQLEAISLVHLWGNVAQGQFLVCCDAGVVICPRYTLTGAFTE